MTQNGDKIGNGANVQGGKLYSDIPEHILSAKKEDLLGYLIQAREDLGAARAVIDQLTAERDDLTNSNRQMCELLNKCKELEEKMQIVDRAPPSQTLKLNPGTYDGATDWSEYAKQFSIVARVHGWSEQEKAAVLVGKLRGDALTAISGLDDDECMNFDSLTQILSINFAPGDQQSVYSDLLRQRRQAVGEPLDSVYRDIQKWVRMAYPKADKSTRDTITVEHFIDAIQDSSVRIQLRRSVPKNLNEALKTAQQLAAIEKVESTRQGSGSPSKAASSVPVVDNSAQAVQAHAIPSNLVASLDSLKKDLDDLKLKVHQLTQSRELASRMGRPRKPNWICWTCWVPDHRSFEC